MIFILLLLFFGVSIVHSRDIFLTTTGNGVSLARGG